MGLAWSLHFHSKSIVRRPALDSFLSEMETKEFSIEMKEQSLVGSMQDTPGYRASEQWIQGLTCGLLEGL